VIYERSSAMGLGVILSKYYRCPMITEVNDNIYHRLSLIHARKIITTFRGLIPREYHQKVIELSWGANHKRFNPEIDGKAIKRRYHIENKFIIGYAGGFYNYHGLMDTVQVARGFTNDSSIRFMLVGSGDESKKIASLINKYKLNEQFILTGKIPYEEIPAYIASFDICIAPYNPYKHKALKNYGFYFNPLKIFEYLAMKKPVITTKLGNISKLFKHREHLYMIESGNIAELKDAIRELIYDSSLRNKLANCGYNYFIKNFTWKAHCEYLEKIFKETISDY
jgi:glycosyltransferase involved in cell wall biosynthesis